jgi:hypothetical protein
MPKWETLGIGITQRKRARYDVKDAGDLLALQNWKPVGRFDAAERWALAVLRERGLPEDVRSYTKVDGVWVPFQPGTRLGRARVCRIAEIAELEGHAEDSDVGYAARCLETILLELKPAIARGDAPAAAHAGLTLGLLLMQALMKERWEKPALAGDKSSNAGRENLRHENDWRRGRSRESARVWQAAANKIWKKHPNWGAHKVSEEVAGLMASNPNQDLARAADTIRKKIVKPK